MRRIVLVSSVLGGGTALVFALAALTATLFPHGTVVNNPWAGTWGGGIMPMEDVVFAKPMPLEVSGDIVLEAVP